MYFRPYLWLTVFYVPSLAVLVMLGLWQLDRLVWKTELIDSFNERANAAAILPPDAAADLSQFEFHNLALSGRFMHDRELYLTGRTYEGNAGFHIVTPFRLVDGRTVLVNRGWVSESYRDPDKRPFSLVEGETTIEAILRFPGKKGYFVPENEPENGFWFTLVPEQIVAHLGLQGRAESAIYAAALRTSDTIELPIAARTETNLRNSHLGYAVTWYGIACALIGVYLTFHYQAGRLRFARDDGAADG